jgi:hypothetical protein
MKGQARYLHESSKFVNEEARLVCGLRASGGSTCSLTNDEQILHHLLRLLRYQSKLQMRGVEAAPAP